MHKYFAGLMPPLHPAVSFLYRQERNQRNSRPELRSLIICTAQPEADKLTRCHPELVSGSINFYRSDNVRRLKFASRSQNFAHVTSSQYAQSVRYPDSLRSVRTQIRFVVVSLTIIAHYVKVGTIFYFYFVVNNLLKYEIFNSYILHLPLIIDIEFP